MESGALLRHIQQTGFKPLDDIRLDFANENQEVVNSVLDFLVSKNKVRKIQYESPTGAKTLYYVPKE